MRLRPIALTFAILATVAVSGTVRPPLAGAEGVVTAVRGFGDAEVFGSPRVGTRQVAIAPTSTGEGYWVVDGGGQVETFGDASTFGDVAEMTLAAPIVDIAAMPDDRGYFLAASDGGIFAFGSAQFLGSLGAIRLNRPVVGMAVTPSGLGYWMVASDGGIFTFGDAPFLGALGAIRLHSPVVGMAATPSGDGYWMVASDGGIFTFGDAPFLGSAGDVSLNQPITGMAPTGTTGYWLAGGDGGVFTYGAADFLGSLAGPPGGQIVDITATPSGRGYWLLPSGTALGEDCEGNGYRVAYPSGWHANSGRVGEPCRFFDADPFEVPRAGEFVSPAVSIDILPADADTVVESFRQSAVRVLSEHDDSVDGAVATVLEWTARGEAQITRGSRLYGYVVGLPDGRALTMLTRSVSNGSYDLNTLVLDEMADSLDLLVLDVDTAPETVDAGTIPANGGHLVDARLTRAPGFDRLVLELAEGFQPAWNVRYVEGPARRPGSGDEVEVDGSAMLRVTLSPVRTAALHLPGQPPTYAGPARLDGRLGNITEAVLLGDFEATLEWAIGVEQRAGFRVFHLSDPSRVVIDVNH